MTTSHAFGFVFLGVGMVFAPAYYPESFLPNAMDGSCTSALWLEVMGAMNFLIGSIIGLRNELTRLYMAFEEMGLHRGRMFDLSEVQWTMPASLYELELAVAVEDRQVEIRSAA
jgi:hypothetical protein